MNKKPVTTTAPELAPLITELRGLIHSARHAVATTVNTLKVMTNFEIGRRIVEHEQKGAERAGYGKELLKTLSVRLTEEFGRGFSEDNLARMRKFYIAWKDSKSEFSRRLRGNLPSPSAGPTTSCCSPSRIMRNTSALFRSRPSWEVRHDWLP